VQVRRGRLEYRCHLADVLVSLLEEIVLICICARGGVGARARTRGADCGLPWGSVAGQGWVKANPPLTLCRVPTHARRVAFGPVTDFVEAAAGFRASPAAQTGTLALGLTASFQRRFLVSRCTVAERWVKPKAVAGGAHQDLKRETPVIAQQCLDGVEVEHELREAAGSQCYRGRCASRASEGAHHTCGRVAAPLSPGDFSVVKHVTAARRREGSANRPRRV